MRDMGVEVAIRRSHSVPSLLPATRWLSSMVPLIVLVASVVALRVLGRFGVRALESWETCLRGGLALMFLVTASAHWGVRRPDLVQS